MDDTTLEQALRKNKGGEFNKRMKYTIESTSAQVVMITRGMFDQAIVASIIQTGIVLGLSLRDAGVEIFEDGD